MEVVFFLATIFFSGIVVAMFLLCRIGEKIKKDAGTEYRMKKVKHVRICICIAAVLIAIWIFQNMPVM